jgi:hypothetical protein
MFFSIAHQQSQEKDENQIKQFKNKLKHPKILGVLIPELNSIIFFHRRLISP